MKKYLFPLLALTLLLTSCSDYGKKVSSANIEVYYKDGISKEQAEKTAKLFDMALHSSNPNDKSTKSFQLTKPGDTVLLKMVANKEKLASVQDISMYAISTLVSDSIFGGGPVNLTLTDNKFKGFKDYVFMKKEEPGWGDKYESGNVELYANDIGSATAKELAAYLETEFNPATTYSFQALKNEQDDWVIRMVVNTEKMNLITEKDMASISEDISTKVFGGAALQFQLTDETFKPLRTFSYPADLPGK